LPAAALAPLAEFRLEPVEENTATRVPERARVGTGHALARCAPPSGRRPTDLCTLTVRVTDDLSTRPRATQRGFQDDKGFKNTFLSTSPRCAALAAAPAPSCWTCASGDVVLFAAAAPHQPSRSAARARKSMPCGTRRCVRRGSGRAAWVRYLWAAAGFRRAGLARPPGRSGKPGGRSALGRRTDTKQTNTQTRKPTLRFARLHWSASVHQIRHTDARKHAHTRAQTREYTHTQTNTHT
jgi:hypothetical protein